MSAYGIHKTLPGVAMEEAQARVTAALAAQGFGVLTEIDVRATFKKKLDIDHRPYKILGACNPKLAQRALEADPAIGLLLPCNVILDTVDEGVEVAVIDPHAMFRVAEGLEGLEEIADEADRRLRAALDAL